MGILESTKKFLSPYARRPVPAPEMHALGASGRDSVDDPYDYWATDYSDFWSSIKPGLKTRCLNLNPIKAKEILKRPVEEIMADFINTNADLAFIVRSYTDFTITDFELESDNDKSRRRIEGLISDMEHGDTTFLGFLKRLVYGYWVEGASSVELNWSKNKKRATSLSYVPPLSLEFRRAHSQEYNRYYKIVQYIGLDYRNPVVLQDKANPNPYYRYTPANVSGTNPYGESTVEPAMWGIVSRSHLMGTLLGFIQGQITPKGVYAPDLKALLSTSPNIQLTASDVLNFGNKVAEVVRQATNGEDITQNMISSFPILYQVVGAMTEGANFEPLSVMNGVFATSVQLGARLPSILYQPDNLRSSLGDSKTRIDWTSFNDRCVGGGNDIADDVTKLFDQALMGDRTMTYDAYEPEVKLVIKRNDAEIRRMEYEGMKLRSEAQMNVKSLGVFDQKEFRKIVVEGLTEFNNFDLAVPESMKGTSNMPTDKPTGTEPTDKGDME